MLLLSLKPLESFPLAGIFLLLIVFFHIFEIRRIATTPENSPIFTGTVGRLFLKLLPIYKITLLWGFDWWNKKGERKFELDYSR